MSRERYGLSKTYCVALTRLHLQKKKLQKIFQKILLSKRIEAMLFEYLDFEPSIWRTKFKCKALHLRNTGASVHKTYFDLMSQRLHLVFRGSRPRLLSLWYTTHIRHRFCMT